MSGDSRSAFAEYAADGNGEGEPLDVIVNQTLMHYVGIGWIRVRAATEEDYRRFPTVVWEDSDRK